MAWKPFTPLALALVLPLLLLACSDREANLRQQNTVLEARAAQLEAELRALNAQQVEGESGLLIQLAFGAEADLDLYVTDPLLETVYFANREGNSGGVISEDRRCDSQPLRIEEVSFETPLSGRYRIGVDYPNTCDNGQAGEFEQRAAYTVSILHNGKRQDINGSVGYRFFEVAAFDFDIQPLDDEEPGHEQTTP